MPITIGPFSNVPAPGDPIRSDWPQQLTQSYVNTLTGQGCVAIGQANIAAGSLGTLTWTTVSNPAWGSGAALVAPAGTVGRFIVSARLQGPAIAAGFADLILNVGSVAATNYVPQGKSSVSVAGQFDMSAGTAVSVQVYNPNGAAGDWTVNLVVDRLPVL